MSAFDLVFDQAFFETLKRLEVVARLPKNGGSGGERASRGTGAGIEHADWRPYSPGDDVRAIDWRAVARSGRLYVRLRAREEASLVTVLVDASGSMRLGRPPKFLFARRLAAAIAAIALGGLDEVVLGLMSAGGCETAGPFAGGDRLGLALRFLAETDRTIAGGTDLASSLGRYLDGAPRPGTLVVISDFWSEASPVPVMKQAAALGFEGAAVQVLDPAEAEPERNAGGRMRLVDAEEQEELDIEASEQALVAYREEMDAFRARLAGEMSAVGFGFGAITTDRPLDRAVLEDLVAAGVVAAR